MSDDHARTARELIVRMCANPEGGHIGGSMSMVEILVTLYRHVLRIDPRRPQAPDRDILLLSKGHGAIGLYAVLAERGFFPAELLASFGAPDSMFTAHPNPAVPGVEMPTGSLGHGLPLGVGFALAARLDGSDRRCFVVLGDGELQEGSNWEAAMCAGHRELDNLVAVIDRNRLQQGARTEETNRLEPLGDKWRAFGWDVVSVDGHDHAALYEVLSSPHPGKPLCVIANTIKGKGVSFIEDRVEWHHKTPTAEQVELALRELTP